MTRTLHRALAVGLGASVAACTHTDLARNAPGIVDVTTRPVTEADRLPGDPGEQIVTLSYGARAGGGVASVGGSAHASYGVGPEISLGYGTRDTSHREDDWFVLPKRGVALDIGLTALTSEGRGLGPAYAQAGYRWEGIGGVAAGWAWDVNDRTHGPQLTFDFTIFYARMTHQLDTSTSVSLGLVIKGQHGWVWSR